MTRKKMEYYSNKRDEADRVNFWCNPPNHPYRPGVFGVSYLDIIDLDEAPYSANNASRTFGHSFAGAPARTRGRAPRESANVTLLAAVDARVGVVQQLIYPGGTSTEKFYLFVMLLLLPSIRNTGPRVITMDNLSAHKHLEVLEAIRAEGHTVILRPIHSPDFGPVEWLFQMLNLVLKHHDPLVTSANFRAYLYTGMDLITPLHIASFFADAHFPVVGFEYRPYAGNN